MVPEGTHLRENRCKNLGKWQTISGTLLGVAAPQGVVRDLPVLGALRLVTEVSLGSKPDMQELGAAGKPSAAPKECPNRPLLPRPPPKQGAPGFDRPWDGWGLQGFARLYLSSLIWNLGLLLELSSLSYSATLSFFSFFAKLNYIVSAFAMLSCFIPLFSSLVR